MNYTILRNVTSSPLKLLIRNIQDTLRISKLEETAFFVLFITFSALLTSIRILPICRLLILACYNVDTHFDSIIIAYRLCPILILCNVGYSTYTQRQIEIRASGTAFTLSARARLNGFILIYYVVCTDTTTGFCALLFPFFLFTAPLRASTN